MVRWLACTVSYVHTTSLPSPLAVPPTRHCEHHCVYNGTTNLKRISLKMRRIRNSKLFCAAALVITLFIIYVFGCIDHLNEETFAQTFNYPLNRNIIPLVEQTRFGFEPDVDPINVYNYKMLNPLKSKCPNTLSPRLVILVKSAVHHGDRRAVIRKTWGLEHRFQDIAIRCIFLLGVTHPCDENLQNIVDQEQRKYGDILQSDFVDTYYNNTIKTMIGFRWVYEYCPFSDYYLFSDDDMFISVKNLLKFVENPENYPEPHKKKVRSLKKSVQITRHSITRRNYSVSRKNTADEEMPVLYAGFVFKSAPIRHKISKWYVPLGEYPWDTWPPYATAGAFVLSNEVIKNMYVGSLYVKHFRFDDIYLGIVALKLGIELMHCDEFHFYKKKYSPKNYHNLIASHGFDNPEELERIWTTQLTGGRV